MSIQLFFNQRIVLGVCVCVCVWDSTDKRERIVCVCVGDYVWERERVQEFQSSGELLVTGFKTR